MAIVFDILIATVSLSTERIICVFMRAFVFMQRSACAFPCGLLLILPQFFLIFVSHNLVLALSVISSHCFVHFFVEREKVFWEQNRFDLIHCFWVSRKLINRTEPLATCILSSKSVWRFSPKPGCFYSFLFMWPRTARIVCSDRLVYRWSVSLRCVSIFSWHRCDLFVFHFLLLHATSMFKELNLWMFAFRQMDYVATLWRMARSAVPCFCSHVLSAHYRKAIMLLWYCRSFSGSVNRLLVIL